MATGESIVKRDIKRVLVEFGIWYFTPQPGPYQIAGVPDFLGILPWDGRFLGIEAKAPGGRPTENQKRVCAQINASGGVALITSDAAEVAALLKDLCDRFKEAPQADPRG